MTKSRPKDTPLPTHQKRSEETTERLLDAAEHLLKVSGAEAATLRSIAERAGVSVGIVYRRFPNKDAVLRSVYMRYFNRASLSNNANLMRVDWNKVPTTRIAKQLIDGMVYGYRANPSLLKALLLYARTHEDPAFRERAKIVNEEAVAAIVSIFESRAGEISHPRPHEAIRFALTSVATIAQERVIFQKSSDPFLSHELFRLFTSYLGLPLI